MGEKLNVVDEQQIDIVEAAPVRVTLPRGDGRMERLDKFIECEILNRQPDVDGAGCVTHAHEEVGFPETRPRVHEQRVVYGARRFGYSLCGSERESVGGAHNERIETVKRVQRGRHATWLPAASFFRTSSETPLSVSNTPAPWSASAEKLCTARKFSASSISSCVRIKSRGRSCLLYWNTT